MCATGSPPARAAGRRSSPTSGRYAGSLTLEDVADAPDPGRPALDVAQDGPTVSPEAPATTGRDLALLTEARRVPVVDADGTLLGVVAVTGDLQCFCGTDSDAG